MGNCAVFSTQAESSAGHHLRSIKSYSGLRMDHPGVGQVLTTDSSGTAQRCGWHLTPQTAFDCLCSVFFHMTMQEGDQHLWHAFAKECPGVRQAPASQGRKWISKLLEWTVSSSSNQVFQWFEGKTVPAVLYSLLISTSTLLLLLLPATEPSLCNSNMSRGQQLSRTPPALQHQIETAENLDSWNYKVLNLFSV